MDCCISVEKDAEILVSNLNNVRRNMERGVDDLISAIEKLQKIIADERYEGGLNNSSTMSDMVKNLAVEVNKTVSKIAAEHKECNMSVWKIGKVIDDFVETAVFPAFHFDESSDKDACLHEVIVEHLTREGKFDVCKTFVRESGFSDESKFEHFVEINLVMKALKSRDAKPALDWVAKNRNSLNKRKTRQILNENQNTSLELRLHSLNFLDVLKNGDVKEAINYAKKNFPSLVPNQESGVSRLMGAVIYPGPALDQSPYAHLAAPSQWEETVNLFWRTACSLFGVSMESPLAVAVNAGCFALPDMIHTKQILEQCCRPSSQEKLDPEVELSEEYLYHSVFVCPVLKQQTLDSNIPMKLVCGHVISQVALAKLSKPGYRVFKLKCPSCRLDQNPRNAKQVFF